MSNLLRVGIVLALCFTAAPAYAAGHVVNGVTVVDANGVVVGPAYGQPDFPVVVLRFNGRLFALGAGPAGFIGQPLVFGSTDCGGPPFILSSGGLISDAALSLPGTTVYLGDSAAGNQSVVAKSRLGVGQCENIPPPINAKPGVEAHGRR